MDVVIVGLVLLLPILFVSIVAVIAAIALTNAMDKARQRETMADMRAVAAAIQDYVSDHGAPPPANGAFAELIGVLSPGDPDSLPLTDHWGHGYRSGTDGRGSYSLESFGRDGVPGADVTLRLIERCGDAECTHVTDTVPETSSSSPAA